LPSKILECTKQEAIISLLEQQLLLPGLLHKVPFL